MAYKKLTKEIRDGRERGSSLGLTQLGKKGGQNSPPPYNSTKQH